MQMSMLKRLGDMVYPQIWELRLRHLEWLPLCIDAIIREFEIRNIIPRSADKASSIFLSVHPWRRRALACYVVVALAHGDRLLEVADASTELVRESCQLFLT
ncbi:hypothetical protein RRF57_010061 [Xylaria bambusicola]|uniref:Uncharacterized protein n=1 Tax=Xylaria bambusicola TaxID=326684 RepID=A0AAN7URW0_9PEZI